MKTEDEITKMIHEAESQLDTLGYSMRDRDKYLEWLGIWAGLNWVLEVKPEVAFGALKH